MKNDFVRLHFWLPGTRPEQHPASLIVNTPEALEFVLQALYRERENYEGVPFHVTALRDDEVEGSGQYVIGERVIVRREENLQMSRWWNAANGLTST